MALIKAEQNAKEGKYLQQKIHKTMALIKAEQNAKESK